MIAHIITDTYPLGTIVGAPVLVSALEVTPAEALATIGPETVSVFARDGYAQRLSSSLGVDVVDRRGCLRIEGGAGGVACTIEHVSGRGLTREPLGEFARLRLLVCQYSHLVVWRGAISPRTNSPERWTLLTVTLYPGTPADWLDRLEEAGSALHSSRLRSESVNAAYAAHAGVADDCPH